MTIMTATISSPNSMLKQSPSSPPNLSREDRNRQLALHHAHLLQYRKDIEARNLLFTEKLLDLPSSTTCSPIEPSTAESQTVKDALRTFQPSDYNALVEERNIDHRCGYVFCPRANRNSSTKGTYRIITGGKDTEFKVVDTKEISRWCSDQCGKMALYLRVQLSQEPAWTRGWEAEGLVELYHEKRERKARRHDLESPAPSIIVTNPEDLQDRMETLAVERGDKTNIDRVSTKIAVRVKEREAVGPGVPEPPNGEEGQEGAIEGYMPSKNIRRTRTSGTENDVEDIMPTI